MKWTVLFHRVTIILLDFFKPHFLQEPCYQLDSHPLSVCMNVCMLHKITHSRSEIILYSRCFGYTKILAQHHSISPWVACGKIKGDVTQYIRSLIEWKTASQDFSQRCKRLMLRLVESAHFQYVSADERTTQAYIMHSHSLPSLDRDEVSGLLSTQGKAILHYCTFSFALAMYIKVFHSYIYR